MNSPDTIKTITSFREDRFKEKGSLFIGRAYPVETESEAQEILQSVRKEFYDATHHCYAYSINGNTMKYSDDGEPNGTAGIRILNAIQHFELKYVLSVVIRYYGGTKLGVGPLGKAYYESAFNSLQSCEILEKISFDSIEILYDYEQTSLVHHILGNFKVKINESTYQPSPKLKCSIQSHLLDEFQEQIKNSSSGKIDTKVLGIKHYLPKTV